MPDAESFIHPDDSNVRKHNAEEKDIMKCYADKRLQAKAKPIDVGDTVLVKQPRLNKLSTPYNPTPLVVMEREGAMVTTIRGDGSKATRNFYMFRSIPQTLIQEGNTCDDSCENVLPSRKKRPRQPEKTRKSRYIRLSSVSQPKRTVRPQRRLIDDI